MLIAVAEPDAATDRLTVTLRGRDAVGAFTLKRQLPCRRQRSRLRQRAGSRRCAAHPGGPLEGHQVARRRRQLTRAATGDIDLLIAVEFRGMTEWQDISRKLSATPGVEELEVAGLSARGARVTLRYAEGAEQLADALARQGLSLRNAGGNWVLSLR